MANVAKSMLREAFQAWDADGSGTIEREELVEVLAALGSFKPGDIEKIINQADKNGDGIIQYDEFVDWLTRPIVTLGAAALLSTTDLNLRAQHGDIGSPVTLGTPPIARWLFNEEEERRRPVRLDYDIGLGGEHTIVIWAMREDPGEGWTTLIGDSRPDWGLCYGLSGSSGFGLCDPRSEKKESPWLASKPTDAEPGTWCMYIARGLCSTPKPSFKGKTELLVATGEDELRLLGTVDAVGSGLVLSEFGSYESGSLSIATVSVWNRILADQELKELFLWDAVTMGCLTAEQKDWFILNRDEPPKRDTTEDEELTSRLASAASSKSCARLDLSELKIVDSDLPRILDVVEASFGAIDMLDLSSNHISVDGVTKYILPFLKDLTSVFRLSLAHNKDINKDIADDVLDAVLAVPAYIGLTMDCRGTGFQGRAIQKLLNPSPEVADAGLMITKERTRTAAMEATFDAAQATLQEKWATQVDTAVPWPTKGALPVVESATFFLEGDTVSDATAELNALLRKRGKDFTQGASIKETFTNAAAKQSQRLVIKKGPNKVEVTDMETKVVDLTELFDSDYGVENDIKNLLQKGPCDKFPATGKTAEQEQKELRAYLAAAAKCQYDHASGAKFAWPRKQGLPHGAGSGQLIAHFSYLGYSIRPRHHDDFGLEVAIPDSKEVAGTKMTLHEAVMSGKIKIEAASGKSYGQHALHLKLENTTADTLNITVEAGTIFQHGSWVHRQNLMIGRTVHLTLELGQTLDKKLGAFCMNLSCSCAEDDPMMLTAFKLKDRSLLQSQGKVWDFFEGIFASHRAEAGFPDGAKKKGKKGKKK